jgi:hypothetical protein
LTIERYRNAGRTNSSAPLLRSFWSTAFDGAEHLSGVPTTRDAIDVATYTRRVDIHYAATGARVAWMRDFGRELSDALESGISVVGTCVCRAVECPAWEDPRLWRGRELWDALLRNDVSQVPDSAYAQALRGVRARIDPLPAAANRRHSP